MSAADQTATAAMPGTCGEVSNATLTALVFELASQLHIERSHRLALEAALTERGVLSRAELEAAAQGATARQLATAQADRSIRKLLRILSESPDMRVPLRSEAPKD